ncbi:11451_t:CDS:2 [Entrophospora sp. SA101]|nr:16214_t:CDS:2 [Entrophospora sp. SA101]CAJ0905246.1 11451_t:CDS:2 [Entrophospora sp. SA101]
MTDNNFTLVCYNVGKCVCDFRINLYGCKEENLIVAINYVLLSVTVTGFLMSCYFLYSLNTVHIALLLSEAYPSTILAEIGQDVPRSLGFGVAVLIPISTVYSTPKLIAHTRTKTLFDKGVVVDIIGFTQIIGPFVTLTPFAYLTGYYAQDNYDIEKSIFYFRAHYILWGFWTSYFIIVIIIFWINLKNKLNNYIQELENSQNEDLNLKLIKIRKVTKNLDSNIHMNNGKMMDYARNLFAIEQFEEYVVKKEQKFVVSAIYTYYKKEIGPFVNYKVLTRLLTWNEKWFFLLHTFIITKTDEIVTIGVSKLVIKDKTGKTIPPESFFLANGLCDNESEDDKIERENLRKFGWKFVEGLFGIEGLIDFNKNNIDINNKRPASKL